MIKVGCCGFPTSMKKYFENFSLVELNTTFYQYPKVETVSGWREKASKEFEFTVKAHQDISHKSKMKVEDLSIQAFEQMKQICKVLNSKILLFQTSASFTPDKLADAERFFKEIKREELTLVWETRGPTWEKIETYRELEKVLKELNVTHVTDPFMATPAYVGDIAYFRLHGLGKQMYYYQYSNAELQKLKELITPYEKRSKTAYVLFNNLSMLDDALRFMHYLSKGTFPKVTSEKGLASIKEVVRKTRFPASKSILVKRIGWKLVELENDKQVRLETFLKSLPSKTFKNADELVAELKTTPKLDG
ncbi:MAG: DUF72 domain-containing protein [Candidatus Bathycorpusculaceae bacterium]